MIKLFYTGPVCGVNDRYKHAKNSRRLILTEEYRNFRDAMYWTFVGQGNRISYKGKVAVIIRMWIPDKMDSDALLKPIFDAMQLGEVIKNDNQIKNYAVIKNDSKDEPHLEIEISEI